MVALVVFASMRREGRQHGRFDLVSGKGVGSDRGHCPFDTNRGSSIGNQQQVTAFVLHQLLKPTIKAGKIGRSAFRTNQLHWISFSSHVFCLDAPQAQAVTTVPIRLAYPKNAHSTAVCMEDGSDSQNSAYCYVFRSV